MDRRRVAVLAFPDVELLDVVGPLEVFATATTQLQRLGRGGGYDIDVVADAAGPVRASSGLTLVATAALDGLRNGPDTLLVAGGVGVDAVAADPAIPARIRAMAPPCVRRLGSVCTGAFVLAAAGLLDGRRVATHWAHADRLAARFPSLTVEGDAIFVRDGPFYSSAGVTAGMDLALALVEEDFGRDLALSVARSLVLFLKRPGGQAQFSVPLKAQIADAADDPIAKAESWVRDHLRDDLTVERLADQVGMSPRTFARIFARQRGQTPARFVEAARLDAARLELEDTDRPPALVARRCGFGSDDVMRRVFLRRLGVTPSDYRRRFRTAADGAPSPTPRTETISP